MTGPSALDLSRALIRCPSVTPADAGALDVLQSALDGFGFRTRRMPFSEPGEADVDNLFASIGTGSPHFCFAGHTDVVPPGDSTAWSADPFAAEVRDGRLYGRGASDMKCAVAAFVAAAAAFRESGGAAAGGTVSLLITGDEEGPAVNGTVKMLASLRERGERFDACLVGEPTNPHELGEMVKIGRRGSLNAELTVRGEQGHAAYPERADNPIPRLLRLLAAVDGAWLDDGSPHFQPSHVTITSVDVGNPATNVIPAAAKARFNVRFNDHHTGAAVDRALRGRLDEAGGGYELATQVSGEAFLSPPGPLCAAVTAAVEQITGLRPRLDTGGGTSDARFIKDMCPVAEFGMPGDTAHKVDENVAVADIDRLAAIYRRTLARFFAGA